MMTMPKRPLCAALATAISAVAITTLLLGIAAGQTFSLSDAVETVGRGTVNWTSGEVYATGVGAAPARAVNAAQARAMAERAAQVDAYRNLLEVVQGVRVDSETVVENLMTKSDVVRTTVSGVVQGARTVKTRFLTDGSVEMLVAMPMKGAFLNAVVPESFGRPKGVTPPAPLPRPQQPSESRPSPAAPEKKAEPLPPVQPKPAPLPPAPEKKAEPLPPYPPSPAPAPAPEAPGQSSLVFKGGVPSGLVIDGRGLGLKPALLPKIVDPAGREIYVGAVATRANVVDMGAAGYAKDLNAATGNFRVTDNPMVIRGQRAVGTGRSDIMLAQADAQSLRDLSTRANFLENCRVIVVY